MASTDYHHGHVDQPGLEVLQTDGLEVVTHPPPEQSLYPAQYLEHKYPEPQYQDDKAVPTVLDEAMQPPRRRITPKVILLVVGSVAIVIAIVVGAVVGTMKNRTSSHSSSSHPPSPTGTTDPSAQGESGVNPAVMTGTPTSVAAGLAPTAISWGYPHLEIFALTKNTTYSVYRKYRNVNATSDTNFIPAGKGMELVGGGIDYTSVPSIAVNSRMTDSSTYRTEIHTNGKGTGYRKYHDADEVWMDSDPNHWDYFDGFGVVGAPTEVRYDPSVQVMKLFYQAKGQEGLSAWYFQWHPEDNWSNAIEVPGPDLQPMASAVVAWNGNDTRLDIFAVSRANSHLLHASWDAETAKWSQYEDLLGFVTTPPVAVSRGPGLIDVFARGGDAGLWHLAYDDKAASWSNWTRISGDTKIQGQPDAISADANTLDVFAWGEDGSMLHKSFDPVSNSWPLGDGFDVLVDSGLSGPPKSVSDAPGRIYVLAYDDQGQLIWKTLESGKSSSNMVVLANVPMII